MEINAPHKGLSCHIVAKHPNGYWYNILKSFSAGWEHKRPHEGRLSPSEVRANAALIAAAPELLAALQACLAYNDAVSHPDGTGQFPWGPAARAAIARATGGQP